MYNVDRKKSSLTIRKDKYAFGQILEEKVILPLV